MSSTTGALSRRIHAVQLVLDKVDQKPRSPCVSLGIGRICRVQTNGRPAPPAPHMQDPAWTLLTIAAVERETGIGKDTLRAWERRYGFPAPVRNDRGDRAYTWAQVERLRRVNRLIAVGHRPGTLMQMSSEALEDLARTESLAAGASPAPGSGSGGSAPRPPLLPIDDCIEVMRGHGSPGLRRWMLHALGTAGLAAFVRDGVAPLARALGESWADGRIQVFEEHLVTEALQAVLRHALLPLQAALPEGRPRVLLSTVPGEEHLLGLLMAETMLTLGGASCIALGPATPPAEIAAACAAERAEVVALGFSERMPIARRVAALRDVRERLAPAAALWAGGSGATARPDLLPPGCRALDLDGIDAALAEWRRSAGIQPAPASVSSSGGQTRRIE